MSKIKKITLMFSFICLLIGVKSLATSGTVNAPSGLVLREKASKTSNPITTVNDKATVEIIETSDQWYKVKYNNYEGYLFAEYVNAEKVEEPSTTETPTEEPSEEKEETPETTEPEQTAIPESEYPKTVKMLSNAKVYLTPSVISSVIYNVEAEKEVTIIKSLNSWFYITVDNNSGWVRKSFVEEKIEQPVEKTEVEATQESPAEEKEKPAEEPKKEEFKSKKGYIDVNSSVNVRRSASTSADILTTLTTNTEVTVVDEEGDWYKITYGEYTGYISKSFVSDKQVATSRGNFSREQNSTSTTQEENIKQDSPEVTVTTSSEGGESIVEFAKKYLGSSYSYGGTTPSGFDCSGFVYFVYSSCGYSLSRSCPAQATSGRGVSKPELVAGDIVFFNNTSDGSIGHVGIYMGDGRFIHAANPNRGVTTDSLNSGYYNKYFYSARRIIF